MQLSLSIPINASVIPAKGSKVAIGDPLFSISNVEEHIIDIVDELSIKPEEIFKFTVKTVGDTIQSGEIIAVKKKVLGSQKIQAPVGGVISSIDHVSGNIVIQSALTETTQNQQNSFFSGKIITIDTTKLFITVEIAQSEEIVAKSIPRDFGGPLYLFSDESLFYTATEKDIAGKVIVVADLKNHIAAKFETLGAAGFVYLQGQDPTDVPDIHLSKNEFDRLVNAKKKYILFSGFEKKAVIYEDE